MYKIILAVLTTSYPVLHAGVWPAGGVLLQPLQAGSAVTISWDRALSTDRVDIQIWDGEQRTFHTIASGLRADMAEYNWVIPQSTLPGKLYRFVLRDAANPRRAEFSTGFHEILRANSVPTTVEPALADVEALSVSPFPADERARVAWTDFDAQSIDVIDIQGNIQQTLYPASSTRACVVHTRALVSGQYSIVLRRSDGEIFTKTLMVSH